MDSGRVAGRQIHGAETVRAIGVLQMGEDMHIGHELL